MDHKMHTALDAAEINADNLTGAVIYGPFDERIGTVAHVHGTGSAMYAVVDIGGFLGIGSRPVALDVNQLNFMRDEDGSVHAVTSWTREQVDALPEHHH